MNKIQLRAASWLFSEMKNNPSGNFSPEEMLEESYGATENDAYSTVRSMVFLGIIEEHPSGYRLTDKAHLIDNLEGFINQEKIRIQGE